MCGTIISNNRQQKIKRRIIIAILLAVAQAACAQLCTGNLGEPIVKIDFGAGSSTHAGALGSGITSYTYSSADFPYDGSYTVENSTAGSGSVWWSTKDHTGNSGGYMMVVNASLSKTDYFYKNTVTGLCPNTTYEFAAWVINLLRSRDISPPNLTFTIETTNGTILATYNSGTIPLTSSPIWKQYGFYFTTPAGTNTVVLRIRNNSNGGAPANDLALDDITFRACGPNLTAYINGTSATRGCENSLSQATLTADISSGYTNPQLQWQMNTGSGWTDVYIGTTATFVFQINNLPVNTVISFRLAIAEQGNISSPYCRVYSNEVTLTADPLPVAAFEISDIACKGHTATFNSLLPGRYSYTWYYGDGTSGIAPWHIYNQTGVYQVSMVATSIYGCTDSTDTATTVIVYDIPHAEITATPDDTTIYAPEVIVTDLSTGGISCLLNWQDGDETDCTDNIHTYKKAGTYNIMQVVTNQYGCTDTAYYSIHKKPEYLFFVPNAFTPNGDGNNDYFKPEYLGVFSYTMQIFNRWGEKIFESAEVDNGWDGTYKSVLQQPGVYVYQLLFRDEKYLEWHQYRGSVTLLR